MSKFKVFCFGFGQVAESFINKLIIEKKSFYLNVTSRQDTTQINFNNLRFNSYKFDSHEFDKNLLSELGEADYILVSIPPIDGEDIVLKKFGTFFESNKKYKWITYLSATSVYGNHNGNWVTEESKTNPSTPNGIERLKAETSWKDFSLKFNLPIQIFRLAGIYSNEFNILKRLKHGKVQVVDKKNHFFSRIHVDDIGNILFKSLDNFKKSEIYNICDDEPASQTAVVAYGAKLLKLNQPKAVALDKLESDMLKNFYIDSKKVDNKKMKNFFNYKLKYPTYVEGLNHIFNNVI